MLRKWGIAAAIMLFVVIFQLSPLITVWGIILTLALRRGNKPMATIPMKVNDLPKTNLVPDGTYRLRVEAVEYRDVQALKDEGKIKAESKLDNGLNLNLVVQDEGEFFGRHIFEGVDLEGQYNSRSRHFLEACEYPADQDIDTDLLKDAEFIAVIGTRKETKEYPAKNWIKKFMPIGAVVEAE
jgi:hypothetical protein